MSDSFDLDLTEYCKRSAEGLHPFRDEIVEACREGNHAELLTFIDLVQHGSFNEGSVLLNLVRNTPEETVVPSEVVLRMAEGHDSHGAVGSVMNWAKELLPPNHPILQRLTLLQRRFSKLFPYNAEISAKVA